MVDIYLVSASLLPLSAVRNLGVTIDSRLTMVDNVSAVCRACYFQLRQLRLILQSLTSEAATSLVHVFISCRLDYCNALLYGIADCQLQRLQSVQNAAARLVTRLWRTKHIITPILKSLHWLPIRQRVTYKLATLVHKCINGRAPEYLAEFCHPSIDRRPGMRLADSRKLHVPHTQTSFVRSFAIASPRTWNNLPDAIRDSSLSFLTFAKLLKSYLFV